MLAHRFEDTEIVVRSKELLTEIVARSKQFLVCSELASNNLCELVDGPEVGFGFCPHQFDDMSFQSVQSFLRPSLFALIDGIARHNPWR